MFLHKAWAFVKRDWEIESSYKAAFVFEAMKSTVPTISFYYISKLVGSNGGVHLSRYGTDYFSYVLVGVALSQYFMVALGSFGDTIRRQQMAGCLEAMLSTRTGATTVILLSPIYSFTTKAFHMVLVFLTGVVFLGVDLGNMNVLASLISILLSIVCFSALGILSASIIVILKKGDPIEWVAGSLFTLLGGAFFPVTILPEWMQDIASFIPVTYSMDALRLSLFKGYDIVHILPQLLTLSIWSLCLFPFSVWLFSKAIEKGRREGSLMHY